MFHEVLLMKSRHSLVHNFRSVTWPSFDAVIMYRYIEIYPRIQLEHAAKNVCCQTRVEDLSRKIFLLSFPVPVSLSTLQLGTNAYTGLSCNSRALNYFCSELRVRILAVKK